MIMLFWLLFWHAMADFPLQGDYLAKRKNRKIEREEKFYATNTEGGVYTHSPWWMHMIWHALIHAGGVAFITHNIWFGVLEFALHFGIDCLKTEGKISSTMDQWLHVACKVLYVVAISFTI